MTAPLRGASLLAGHATGWLPLCFARRLAARHLLTAPRRARSTQRGANCAADAGGQLGPQKEEKGPAWGEPESRREQEGAGGARAFDERAAQRTSERSFPISRSVAIAASADHAAR